MTPTDVPHSWTVAELLSTAHSPFSPWTQKAWGMRPAASPACQSVSPCMLRAQAQTLSEAKWPRDQAIHGFGFSCIKRMLSVLTPSFSHTLAMHAPYLGLATRPSSLAGGQHQSQVSPLGLGHPVGQSTP